MGIRHKSWSPTMYRKYESCFGAAPFYCAILWYELGLSYFDHAPAARVQPKHLLMALHFLKAYNTEDRSTILHRCDAKTLRRWVWYMLKGIASLDAKFVGAKTRTYHCDLYCHSSYSSPRMMPFSSHHGVLPVIASTHLLRYDGRIVFETLLATRQLFVSMASTLRSESHPPSARIGSHISLEVLLFHTNLLPAYLPVILLRTMVLFQPVGGRTSTSSVTRLSGNSLEQSGPWVILDTEERRRSSPNLMHVISSTHIPWVVQEIDMRQSIDGSGTGVL